MDDQNQTSDNALMATNGLLYKMPQPLSVCLNKTFKKEYAQRQSYSESDTIVFDINSGSSYIDPTTCMLSFKLNVTGEGEKTFNFGSGMASNLIREIRILSKNGCEVDRTQNAHVLAKILKDYTTSVDERQVLTNAGLQVGSEDAEYKFSEDHTFVIPLDSLSGFFRPTVKGMRIPAGLASGLRIEFITENAGRALTSVSADSMKYTIKDPEILFMCMDLNDPTQAVLMKNSAETGLEYTFPSYVSTPTTASSSRVNEQVKKAVSQCTRAFCGVYKSEDINSQAKDGFSSIKLSEHEFKEFQYRVGSSYYPHKMVNNVSEAWYVSCSAFDSKTKLGKCNSMTLDQYINGGKFVIAVPIETDSRLNLSGIPLNNSNVLELRCAFSTAGSSLEYNIFIEHITIARTFVNQTTIKI